MENALRWTVGALVALNIVAAGLLLAQEPDVLAPPPDLDVATIRLLAEIPDGAVAGFNDAKSAGERSGNIGAEPHGPPSRPYAGIAGGADGNSVRRSKICMSAGPFETLDALRDVRAELSAQGATVRVVEEEVSSGPDYLVYVEPSASNEIARRLRDELDAQSIDSYVIREGDLMDAISVGLFSKRELAYGQRDRISELGYEVAVRDLNRTHTVYRLLAQGAAVDTLPVDGGIWVPCGEIAAVDRIL